MKPKLTSPSPWRILPLLLGWLALSPSLPAATYQVGDTVNDFTLYARRAFTSPNGHAYQPGDPVRLTDFQGSILFIEFFFYW